MVEMRNWKYFGAYSTMSKAKAKVNFERSHGFKGDWHIIKHRVGKSVDNAYSDRNGYEYQVWIEREPRGD
jgi:hypothetical protein